MRFLVVVLIVAVTLMVATAWLGPTWGLVAGFVVAVVLSVVRIERIPPEQRAEQGAKDVKAAFASAYDDADREFVDAEIGAFRHLDRKWYDAVAEELDGLGLKHLWDVEDLTHTASSPGTRTMIRVFGRADGKVGGSAYQLRTRGLAAWTRRWFGIANDIRVVEVESAFSDGHMLNTLRTNSPMPDPAPFMDREIVDPAVALADCVARHEAKLEALSAQREVEVVLDRETWVAVANREHRRLAEYRRSRGPAPSRAELVRWAGKSRALKKAANLLANVLERERETTDEHSRDG